MGSTPMSSSELFDRIAHEIYQQGYCVIRQALPEKLGMALAREVRTLPDDRFSRAGIGRQADYQNVEAIRRDEICWIDNSTPAGQEWLLWTDGLKQALNRRLFLGLFSFESHYAHYREGDFYKVHLDAFRGQQNRVLTVVTYLNPDWTDNDGGELLIYPEKSGVPLLTVQPEFGTLVVFLSEEFPHEVLPARADRYSIAGWYRINTSDRNRVDPEL
ncbi:2OG-Fe(II) oxygenase [Amphritea atlantica]|nr:2OG-Fe(II) oxygenase [Amphritea atlantica]